MAYSKFMAKYVVTYSDIFNDVEINGFRLMTDKEVDLFEKLLESISWEIRYPLSSGEDIIYSNGDALYSQLDFKEVSQEEFKAIKKVFTDGFGIFIDEDFLTTLVDEETDVDDEDNQIDEDGYRDYYGTKDSDDYDDDY